MKKRRCFVIIFTMAFLIILQGLFSVSVAWEIMTVDSTSLGSEIQMVNHPTTDNPAIVYFDSSTQEFKYSILNNNLWDMTVVKSFTNYSISDWDACLDFDSQTGYPSVTYFDENWNLFYAANLGGSQWYEEPVDYNVFSTVTSFAFDHNGTAWIAYQDYDQIAYQVRIKIARKSGINWNVFVFEEDAAAVNLAINPATGYPSVAYFKISSYAPPQAKLMYAYFNGSVWVKEVVDKQSYIGGGPPSLAFNPNSNYPAIACTSEIIEDDGNLKYSYWNGSSWIKETVDDTGNIWGQIGLAFNPASDTPSAVYCIEDTNWPCNTPLMYAHYDGSQWRKEVVDHVTYTNVIGEKSLTFSKDGTARIAYDGGALKYAYDSYEPNGELVTSDLWIGAVINTEEKGPIEAVWQKGGEDTTSRGDRVIWGHFYASPSDVTWGSENNPDLFVKIWFDVSGRIDVNFFHVSVPNIEVYSDYPYDGTPDEQGTTTMNRRYIRQYYENGKSYSSEQDEDGNPPSGYSPTGNPSGYSIINDLRIGAIINTVEKGTINAVWHLGGQDTTSRGDQVVWGHFYASPTDVTWGSENNPDLFVKIWFDVSGRVDVNFFHVSVPDIEVYSALPDDGSYDQQGTTIMDNRYIRHEYQR